MFCDNVIRVAVIRLYNNLCKSRGRGSHLMCTAGDSPANVVGKGVYSCRLDRTDVNQ